MQEVAKQVKAMCARTEQITEKATKHLIPAPKFDGHGDVNLFINRYNETALLNNWEGEEKLLRFKMSISGPPAVGIEGKTFEMDVPASRITLKGRSLVVTCDDLCEETFVSFE